LSNSRGTVYAAITRELDNTMNVVNENTARPDSYHGGSFDDTRKKLQEMKKDDFRYKTRL